MFDTSADFHAVKPGAFRAGLSLEEIGLILRANPGADKTFLLNSHPPVETAFGAGLSISKRLITISEYEEFAADTGHLTLAEDEGWGWLWQDGWKKTSGVSWRNPFMSLLDNRCFDEKKIYPVMQISWIDADAFCGWLSRTTGVNFFLPDEFLWERGSAEFSSPAEGSVCEPVKNNIAFLDALESRCGAEGHPAGLLWEWTADWFEGYPGSEPNREFGHTYKVLRGGSAISSGWQRHHAYRFRRCPTARSPYYGFRIALNSKSSCC